MEDLMNKVIAERIKEAMEYSHMNQKNLATLSGLSEPTISKYLSCKRLPRIDQLRKIAGALNVNLSFLLGESNHLKKTDEVEFVLHEVVEISNHLDKATYYLCTETKYMSSWQNEYQELQEANAKVNKVYQNLCMEYLTRQTQEEEEND